MKKTLAQFSLICIVVALVFLAEAQPGIKQPDKANTPPPSLAPDWPDSPEKQEFLKHCAQILRSSIDTKQIELVYDQLTNQPTVLQRTYRTNVTMQNSSPVSYLITNNDIVTHFEGYTSGVVSNLNRFADLLADANLQTYIINHRQYCARVINPFNTNEVFLYTFLSRSGPVRGVEIRTNNEMTVAAFAEFHENGKLKLCDNIGHENISFYEDGRLDKYFCNLYQGVAIALKFDDANNIRVLSYNSMGLKSVPTR